jgi:hypothetical protein
MNTKSAERGSKLISRFEELLLKKQGKDKRKYKNKEIVAALGDGFSVSTIMRLKSGRNFETMPLWKIQRVADWLGVNMKDLVVHEKETA